MKINEYGLNLMTDHRPKMVREASFDYKSIKCCNEPSKVVEMLNECFQMNKRAEEYVYMISFDNCLRPIAFFELAHGSITSAPSNPREIFVRALLSGAVYIMIAHNHPSGNLKPSDDDDEVFHRIKEAGNLIGVKLLDVLIVGGDSYKSYHEDMKL